MIWGFEGGIGTGKTLSLVHLGLMDLFDGKHLYSNVKLKNLGKFSKNVTYLNKENLKNIYELTKSNQFDMRNSTVLIQEAHNYMDSRRSMFKDNMMISYWVLQSRHFGQGSSDILYDTQELGQVDKRLRRNTDFTFRPTIISTLKGVPHRILLNGTGKIGHVYRNFNFVIDVHETLKRYDTHEVVEF